MKRKKGLSAGKAGSARIKSALSGERGYRGIAVLLLALLLIFCPAGKACAQESAGSSVPAVRSAGQQETTGHVYDQAGLLDGEEAESLEQRCQEVETEDQIHILLVTVSDTRGKTSEEYADDFYDSVYPEEKDENGMAVLINMEDREMWISTAGIMRYYLSDREIDQMLDRMYSRITEQDYAGALESAVDSAVEAIERGVSSRDYLIDENGKVIRYRRVTPFEAALAAAVGIGCFCLVYFGVRYSYQKKIKSDARGYARANVVKHREEKDLLIDRHVTVRKIPRNPPPGQGGGGGSSVHTSSSGRSHGGGGRSF